MLMRMSEWAQLVNRWIAVLIQIGAVIAALGLSWNLKDIILDTTLGGSGPRAAQIAARCLGIVLAFLLLAGAPGIVNAFQGWLRTPLLR